MRGVLAAVAAVAAFAADVREGRFPSEAESYRLDDQASTALGLRGGASKTA